MDNKCRIIDKNKGVYPAVGTKPLLRDKCLVCNAGTTHSMLQNGIFMVIFILFFSIFLAACGIGNIWCQLLGKRQNKLLNEPIIYRVSTVYLPCINRKNTVVVGVRSA